MLANYIDGRFVEAQGATPIPVLNPARGTVITHIPDSPRAVVDEAIDAARRAQPGWGKLTNSERAVYLRRIAARLRDNEDALSHTLTEEIGKLRDLARGEVATTANFLDYMAEWALRIEGEILPSERRGETILMQRKPMGVVGGILPWNFPFFLIARKAGPALLTGNTIVIKPSEETPGNADFFARLLDECDLPPGVFNIVHGTGKTVGEGISSHKGIDMVSFTGSVPTGIEIMKQAAANVTKVNLELGGKAPAIVMNDADLDIAIPAIRISRILNNGQVCNCAERVYVQRGIADEFTDRLVKAMRDVTYGDPLGNAPVDMGPMIHEKAALRIAGMIETSVGEGATLLTGGKHVEQGGGHYIEPTVLTGCAQDSDMIQKEIFGPVMPIHVVDELDEAIAKANDSEFGLTSSIYTRSLSNILKTTAELNFGETYVNRENMEAMQGYHAGMRKSGIGGADGKHGLLEYTQTQMVYLQN
ncbi:aldehyde dehydrogenase [Sphingobium nicotianae]|uniref:Aldehyde dehydrogenase n=1 Tax=Sphingobium nicotianae TaxID=2782607 RepID=A0A9X1DB58_9SPHN|nr:aldehyde dehydrogenase [Sphingobium nicotianae]MBT2186746.1 aldehyde dehydrogenase [Sphingobium nicotianae]